MANSTQNLAPLTFGQWQQQQPYIDVEGGSSAAYIQYTKQWYKNKIQESYKTQENLKQDYIQLLKDLNYLFSNSETDLFVKDVNYDNPEDLILAIPFFARKLKEIAKLMSSKRESIKRAKNKYNLVGSSLGLESLLYDYILRTFTQKEGYVTQIPISALQKSLPALSAIKNDFFIELEELHDPANYHDSDPSKQNTLSNSDLIKYLGYDNVTDFYPFIPEPDYEAFTPDEIMGIVSTKFLSRAAQTPLLNTFQGYLSSITLSPSLSADLFINFNNQVEASKKYLGETLYGLTAVRLDQIQKPDYILNLSFEAGDNWFLWPSGYQQLENTIYNNSYYPINLVDSNLVTAGATAGTNYTQSDLIFSDKNGVLEGAWLQGPYTAQRTSDVKINLVGGDITEFLFPYVGYDISSTQLSFERFNTVRSNEKYFNALTPKQQRNILSSYYTSSFPSSASNAIYLNQTTLINDGATAGFYSDEADLITKRPHDYTLPTLHSGADTEVAYAYKFQRTDLPVIQGNNDIQWPIQVVQPADNLPIVFTENDCLPIRLIEINSSYAMAGAVAGQTLQDADVIYKVNSRGDVTQSVEAAWFGSEPIYHLNISPNDIKVYGNKCAIDCSHALDGSIQGSLAFQALPYQKISFVWCGEDTYADDVFRYIPHEKSCPYGKGYPHDYYKDQDYANPSPLYNKNYWTQCSCKSVHYSPIGHVGSKVTDYNGLTDYLYADPYGLGDKFTLGSWVDTRGLNIKDSPQFSFYHLDGAEGDTPVGYGTGQWKTSNSTLNPAVGDRMVLKTGKRYTYCRTGLRTNSNSGNGTTISATSTPYFVINYIYPKVNAVMCDGGDKKYDIIIALDCSRSQSFDFDKLKAGVGKICTRLINACSSKENIAGVCYNRSQTVQVGLIAFNGSSTVVSNLTNSEYELNYEVNALNIPTSYPEYTTNIKTVLLAANYLLNNNLTGDLKFNLDFKTLCSDLNNTIFNQSKITKFLNIPQKNAHKKIILLSDGIDNVNYVDDLLKTASDIKSSGTEIYSIDVGQLSITNDLMSQIASSDQTYFSLYKYLISGDGNYDSFIDYISLRLNGCVPFYPIWRKAIKDSTGNWVGTVSSSDMVLRPNDFLIYYHQSNTSYKDLYNSVSFTQPSVAFTINVKLDGWDYNTSSFSKLNVGPEYGAKPFWGSVPTNPIPQAGQIRFVQDYLPVHQPDVSKMVLNNADYIQYTRYGNDTFLWNQPTDFTETINTTTWNELIFNKKYSNLESVLRSNKTDWIVEGSFVPSSLILESYSEYKPARYHYYAQKAFNYTENLYLRNNCNASYVELLSGVIIEPSQPYANLDNRFYPTVAMTSFPELAVTEKQIGGYLLPENLGVSTYRGRGYTYVLDKNLLSTIDSLSAEHVFLNIQKYGSRNRGLTQKDQLAPFSIKDIDNKWVMEPYGSGARAGVILGTRENQKFTPYQSSYEMLNYNNHGVARQSDQFQFWNLSDSKIEWNDKSATSNFRQEIDGNVFADRVSKLLTNKGTMVQWRNDIFGYDYGLYKHLPTEVLQFKPETYLPSLTLETLSPSSVNIPVGEYYAFGVEAYGDAPFSYQWYRDGLLLSGSGLSVYAINKARPALSGTYVCVVSNMYASVSSQPIYVTVS